MLTRRRFLSGLVLLSLAQNGFASPSSQSVLKQLQKIDANILLMRHALAPALETLMGLISRNVAPSATLTVGAANKPPHGGKNLETQGLNSMRSIPANGVDAWKRPNC